MFFDAMKQMYKEKLSEIHKEKQKLSSELTKTTQKMDGLIDMRINEELTAEQYKEKSAEFSEKIRELNVKITALVVQDEGILDLLNKSVELLTNLVQYWESADKRTKLGIIDMISVELFVTPEKSLKIKENEVFEVLRSLNCIEWLPELDSNQ